MYLNSFSAKHADIENMNYNDANNELMKDFLVLIAHMH